MQKLYYMKDYGCVTTLKDGAVFSAPINNDGTVDLDDNQIDWCYVENFEAGFGGAVKALFGTEITDIEQLDWIGEDQHE